MTQHLFNMVCTWKILFQVLSLFFPLDHHLPWLTHHSVKDRPTLCSQIFHSFSRAALNLPSVTPWEPKHHLQGSQPFKVSQRRKSQHISRFLLEILVRDSGPASETEVLFSQERLSQPFPVFIQFPSHCAGPWVARPAKVWFTHILLWEPKKEVWKIQLRLDLERASSTKGKKILHCPRLPPTPWELRAELEVWGSCRGHWYVLRNHQYATPKYGHCCCYLFLIITLNAHPADSRIL